MNQCDFDHNTNHEVRLLPYGGGGNIMVCYSHFQSEIRRRKAENQGRPVDCQFDLPTWASLEVAQPAATR